MTVYPLWFKARHDTYLFGIYASEAEHLEARRRYLASGQCGLSAGYFQPVSVVVVGTDLATGYLKQNQPSEA